MKTTKTNVLVLTGLMLFQFALLGNVYADNKSMIDQAPATGQQQGIDPTAMAPSQPAPIIPSGAESVMGEGGPLQAPPSDLNNEMDNYPTGLGSGFPTYPDQSQNNDLDDDDIPNDVDLYEGTPDYDVGRFDNYPTGQGSGFPTPETE
jgi:hypothetical protein